MTNFATLTAGSADAERTDGGFSEREDAAVPTGTGGALLRDAREAAGLHIAVLAVLLKIPVRMLEALEQDRFDLLPDAVFGRALAASVCRTLKLDPAQVLERLPPSRAPRLNDESAGINTPFRSSDANQKRPAWTQVSRPVVFVGLAFLLGTLILIFLPTIKSDADLSKTDVAQAQAGGYPTTAASSSVGGLFAPPTEQPARLASSTPAGDLDNSAEASPEAVPATAQAMAAMSTDLVTFRASSESWVKVTDAKGVVVLSRTLNAGEALSATGALPLTVVVGRADVTQVQVRGHAFDLADIAKSNVARFEVK